MLDGAGTFTPAKQHLRGGFRYLTLTLMNGQQATITNVTLAFSAAPTMPHPRDYANHFYCSDDLLNAIWYAGAYTVQLSSITPSEGRVWPPPASGWDNSALAGVGDTVCSK